MDSAVAEERMPDADRVFEVVDSEPECCDDGTAAPSYAESSFMDGVTDRNSEILVIPETIPPVTVA